MFGSKKYYRVENRSHNQLFESIMRFREWEIVVVWFFVQKKHEKQQMNWIFELIRIMMNGLIAILNFQSIFGLQYVIISCDLQKRLVVRRIVLFPRLDTISSIEISESAISCVWISYFSSLHLTHVQHVHQLKLNPLTALNSWS